jgi:hypothetical protein
MDPGAVAPLDRARRRFTMAHIVLTAAFIAVGVVAVILKAEQYRRDVRGLRFKRTGH